MRFRAVLLFSVLATFPVGCRVPNSFQGDLNALLKDVPAFNKDHGSSSLAIGDVAWPAYEVKGLDLKGARFNATHFKGSRISRCRFTDCEFDGTVFEAAAITESEFVNCRFHKARFIESRFEHCRFVGGNFSGGGFLNAEDGPGETAFDTVLFSGTRFADVLMKRSVFTYCKFENPVFENVDYQGPAFNECQLLNAKFGGRDFAKAYFNASTLNSPEFHGPDLCSINYNGSVITDANLAPVSTQSEMNFGVLGLTFRKCSFDLEKLKGHFGLSGAEDCAIRNFKTRGDLGLRGIYRNVSIENIDVVSLELNRDAEFHGLSIKNATASHVFMELSHFQDCTVDGLHVKHFMKLDSSTFGKFEWKNVKLEPGVNYSAKGTPFESKKPF
jgi:uncharacterized protein YjbI with pentapeptide repeats